MMKHWIIYGIGLFVGLSTQATGPKAFAKLEAGGTVYYRVRVKEVTPQAIIIFHSQGMSQVALKDLPVELQQAFGYSEQAEEKHLADSQRKHAQAMAQIAQSRQARMAASSQQGAQKGNQAAVALSRFGQPPAIQEEVDLRPEFRRLELVSKSQGRRPSCSVFAVVSALEFQNAKIAGKAEKLSEDYLIWATLKSLGLRDAAPLALDEDAKDTGFTLLEVVQALRSYGIPLQASMPNTFGKSMMKIEPPSAAVIADARARRKVYAYSVTGRDSATKIDNVMHALNEGVPVVLGVQWPVAESLASAPILSKQKPRRDYAHAITLVGYRSDDGDRNSLRFVFKNSWGNNWGINGYGWVTYEYLQAHLRSAVVLDVGV